MVVALSWISRHLTWHFQR